MRRRSSIKDRVNHTIDGEGFAGAPEAKKLSAHDHEQMSRDRIDALEMENDAAENVELLTDLKETAEEIQDTVDEVLENIENMTDVEIGQNIEAVESLVEELGENVEELVDGVDAEAMTQDPKAVARILLASYREKADNALAGSYDAEGFLDIFKSSKTKLKEAEGKAKTWVENNNAKIEDLNATIADKVDEIKEKTTAKDIAKKLGNRLATVRASNTPIAELTKYADSVATIPNTSSDVNTVDKNILTFIKGFDKGIKVEDFVKAVRVDGKSLSYMVLSKVKDLVGIREYKTISIPGGAISSAINSFKDADVSVEYAKQLITTAKSINDKLLGKVTALNKEADIVENMLKVDINQAKWDKGDGLKFNDWNRLLLLVGSGALGGAGGVILAAGGLTAAPAMIPLVAAAGYGSMLIGLSGAKQDYEDKKKNFEELEAKDKERILRARAELTARYANDAIFGLNNLANELLDAASIILSSLKDKEEKKDA